MWLMGANRQGAAGNSSIRTTMHTVPGMRDFSGSASVNQKRQGNIKLPTSSTCSVQYTGLMRLSRNSRLLGKLTKRDELR
jgi:hypothetical protein